MAQALAPPSSGQWLETKSKLEHELSERQELELQLRRSENGFRATAALIDLTHDAVFVRNQKDEIIFWNTASEKLYGWRKDEVAGKITHDLLHAVFPEAVEHINADMATTGTWEGELVHQRRDGTTVIVSSRWAMSANEGEPVRILESNRDISKLKEAETAVP